MKTITNADEILFRASSNGYLMVEPREKSPMDKYTDAKASLDKKKADYIATANKETKTAIKLRDSIQKLTKEVEELEKHKDDLHLSETVKTHLIDVFVRHKYNRFTEINSKYLEKGSETEADSVTIISRINKKMYRINTVQLSNEYVSGTPDISEEEDITKAESLKDAKSSYTIFTFHRAKHKELNPIYYWQGQTYMWLTGAKRFSVDYCLNNTPYHLIEAELRRESYNWEEGNTPAWVELQLIANHVYDKATFQKYIDMRGIAIQEADAIAVYNGFVEVPLSERHFSFEFERNDEDIERLKNRIIECRKWMNENLFQIAA